MRSIIIGMWKMYFLFGVLFIIASQSGVSAKASCRKAVNDLILPSHTKLVQNSKSKDRFRNVKLVCENGYFFATRLSTAVIKCKNGVILTNPIPNCGGCGVPGNISNGTVTFTSTAVKSHVTYSCDVGFTLVGKIKRKCRQRLKWSGREPSCKRCGVPGNISNGTVTFTSTAVKSHVTYSCNVGFTLVGKRKRKCRQRLKWSGREPSCKRSTCRAGTCKHGVCDGSKCVCESGFTGVDCNNDNNECDQVDMCKNGGSCNNVFGGYTCSCVAGFTGKNCSVNIDECIIVNGRKPCQNGGACVDKVGQYMCNCTRNYTGMFCEYENECMTKKPCGTGKCRSTFDGKAKCHCDRGVTGTFCERDINECNQTVSPCDAGRSTCHNTFGSYKCI